MDIYCRNCGEPWDNDCIHDVAQELGTTYAKVAKDFSARGCKALASDEYGSMNFCKPDSKASQRGLLADLLGDDMDGMSAMLEDMEYMGMI